MQAELFAGDIRLYPLGQPAHLLPKAPFEATAGEELFVELTYKINAEGRANGVRIIAGNIANAYKRDLQSWFQLARFRPRIEAGRFVERPAMTHRQIYKVEVKAKADAAPETDPASP